MGLITGIQIVELSKIIDIIFDSEVPVTIYEAYSGLDKEMRSFANRESLNAYIDFKLNENDNRDKDINLSLHYLDTGGSIFIEKLDLNSEACDGATFRYTSDGWGVINFNLFIEGDYCALFCLHARDKKEALEWHDTYPEFGCIDLWNWPCVSSHLKRLRKSYNKLHKKLAKKL